MTSSIKRLPLVPIGVFFLVSGAMGTRPLVPLLAVNLGMGVAEIGLLVAAFSAVPLGIAAMAGPWIDRNGSGPALLYGILITAFGVILPFLMPGRLGLYLSQLGAGVGFTLFMLAAQKVAGMAEIGLSRERSVAAMSLGAALGSLVGPLIGGFTADHLSYGMAFLALGLMILLAALPLWRLFGRSPADAVLRHKEPPGLNPLRVLSYHPFMGRAFLVSMLVLIGKDMYVAYFPLYALAAGMSASWIGMVVAVQNIGGVVMRFFMVPMVTAFGKNAVLVVSVMCAGLCFLALPLTYDPLLLLLISIVMGFGLGIGQPLSISRTINLSPPDRVGEVLGMRLASNRLTQFIAPLLIGAMSVAVGLSGIFIAIGALLLAGATRLGVPAEAEKPVAPKAQDTK